MKIAIVGGGASGVFCSIFAKNDDNEVTIFESNEKLMKKLFITGKGRCNLTNNCGKEELFQNIIRNPKFLMSTFEKIMPIDVMNFFEEGGLRLKTERGGRVFPESDKSSDVLRVLEKQISKKQIKVVLDTKIEKILKNDDNFSLVYGKTVEHFDVVVVATGGLTYNQTGSCGDGYKFARELSHTVESPRGALVGFVTNGGNADIAGLALKNVLLKVVEKKNRKVRFSQVGEMLFTHTGVSGPLILTASSHFAKKNLSDYDFVVDLKMALDRDILDKRVLSDFEKYINKDFKNALSDLLPQALIERVITLSKIERTRKVNEITKEERGILVDILKNFPLFVKGFEDDNQAIITCGGVKVKEISPQTMESKKVSNIYFVGEVLDIDALTGGFNLQIAFSTAFVAGMNISEMENAEVI